MQWMLKSKDPVKEPQVYSRAELFHMLYSDQLSLNDLVRLSNAFDDSWKPVYEWPELFSPVTSISKGINLYYKNCFIKAKIHFLSSLKIPEFFPLAAFYLGLLAAHENDFYLAINYFQNAQRLKLLSPLCKNNEAVCIAFSGNWSESLALLASVSDNFKKTNERVQLNQVLITEMTGSMDTPETFSEMKKQYKLEQLLPDFEGDIQEHSKKIKEEIIDAPKPKFNEPVLLNAIIDDPEKHLLVFIPEFYNDFITWSVKGHEDERLRYIQADAFLTINKAKDLYDSGNFYEAFAICESMIDHKFLGEKVKSLKSKCEIALFEQLYLQYNEFVKNKQFSKAMLWLIQIESRFPKFLDCDKEKLFLKEHEKSAIDQQIQDILPSYINTFLLKHQELSISEVKDVHSLINFKEELEDFLSSYEKVLASGHTYAGAVKKRVQDQFLETCIANIKQFFKGVLDTLFEQGKIRELVDKTLIYRNMYSALCKELQIDLDQYINLAIQYYKILADEMENNLSTLDSKSLIKHFKAVAEMRSQFPENDELSVISCKFLDKLFSKDFFTSTAHENIEAFVPKMDRPRVMLHEEYHSALKSIDDIIKKIDKKEAVSPSDLFDILHALPTYDSPGINLSEVDDERLQQLSEQLKEKIVSGLFQLNNFLCRKREYGLAIEVMDILISRFRVQAIEDKKASIEKTLAQERSVIRKKAILMDCNDFQEQYYKIDLNSTDVILSNEIEILVQKAEKLLEFIKSFQKEFPDSSEDLENTDRSVTQIYDNLQRRFYKICLEQIHTLLKDEKLGLFYQKAATLYRFFPIKCWSDFHFRELVSKLINNHTKEWVSQKKIFFNQIGIGDDPENILTQIEKYFVKKISAQRQLDILNELKTTHGSNGFVDTFIGRTVSDKIKFDFENKDFFKQDIRNETDFDLLENLLSYQENDDIKQYLSDTYKKNYHRKIQSAFDTIQNKLVADSKKEWPKIKKTDEFINGLKKYRWFFNKLIGLKEYKTVFIGAVNRHKEKQMILEWQNKLGNIGEEENIISMIPKKEFKSLIFFLKEIQYHQQAKDLLLDKICAELDGIPDHVEQKHEYQKIFEENGFSILRGEQEQT